MDNPQVTGGGHRVEQDKADWSGASTGLDDLRHSLMSARMPARSES